MGENDQPLCEYQTTSEARHDLLNTLQLRFFTYYPRVTIRRKITLPRPHGSSYTRPITAWLFFAQPVHHFARATDLILDYPGGGFISMTPEHHEERLRMWAVRTGKPVLSIEYGKAPECEDTCESKAECRLIAYAC